MNYALLHWLAALEKLHHDLNDTLLPLAALHGNDPEIREIADDLDLVGSSVAQYLERYQIQLVTRKQDE